LASILHIRWEMRRFLLGSPAAILLLLSACLGGTGATGSGTPGSSSFTDHSGTADAGRFLTSPAGGAAADKPLGPITPNGDSEGIHCPTAEPPRVRYGPDFSLVVDRNSDPAPTLDLGANGQWDLQFQVEIQVVECGITTYWVAHHPGMKVRFIQDPDNSMGARAECDVLLDPLIIDPTMMPKNDFQDFHQLSVSAVSGKLSMYYDFDYPGVGGPDCNNHVLAPITDQQFNDATTFATPLGSFNLHLPATSPASPSNQTRAPLL
jgi:hypothetical protein